MSTKDLLWMCIKILNWHKLLMDFVFRNVNGFWNFKIRATEFLLYFWPNKGFYLVNLMLKNWKGKLELKTKFLWILNKVQTEINFLQIKYTNW